MKSRGNKNQLFMQITSSCCSPFYNGNQNAALSRTATGATKQEQVHAAGMYTSVVADDDAVAYEDGIIDNYCRPLRPDWSIN